MVLTPSHVKGIVPGEHAEFEGFSKPVKVQYYPDAVLQNFAGPGSGAASGLNFAGVGEGDYGYSVTFPVPDSNGAVGATQYVQSVAASFAVFDKKTGALVLAPASISSLFVNFGGPCETSAAGDSAVNYDKMADRWVIGTMAQRLPSGEGFGYSCIAVSTSSDATGSYYRYALQLSAIDYQKIGVWPDAYYLGFNNPANTNARVCAMDRNAMLKGATAQSVCFTRTGINTLLPSDMDGRTQPPAGAPNYFVGGINSGKNVLNLFKFHVDFTNTKNSKLTGPIAINVAPYNPSCLATGGYYRTCVPQKGSTTQLETLSDRLMYRNAYRNFSDHETLVVNHAVDVAGANGHSVGIRWYELRALENGNFTVFQQGTYAPDSSSRFMGSTAMDGAGDIALGYGISSSKMFPSIGFSGRVPTDPAGTMGGEKVIFAGQSASGNTLWGDYTSLSVDPADDCTFWYTSQYYKTGQSLNWSTRVASFKFPGCK
ncbi:MAG: hypothetical protein LAO03_13685 [Acidobacteriia bacterium]|nr:hypothetical protein [Terriglobia bacterium]